MSGFESFIATEQVGMSPEAFEAFKERMKKNAVFIKAIKKDEKNQKKHEDKLIKFLIQFIQSRSTNPSLLKLLAAAMDKNIPADFLVAIILLSHPEVQEELSKLLGAPEVEKEQHSDEEMINSGKELQLFGVQDETVPLKIKIEIDNWIKNLNEAATSNPHKILKFAYKEEKPDKSLIDLTAYIINELFEKEDFQSNYSNTVEFAKFTLKAVLKNASSQIKDQKLIKD